MSTFAFLGTQELIIVAVIALVLFGGNQIPKLARNLGKAQRSSRRDSPKGRPKPRPSLGKSPRAVPTRSDLVQDLTRVWLPG